MTATTTIVTDCPRCGTKRITFDVLKGIIGKRIDNAVGVEAFCRCRHCSLSTVFLLKDNIGLGLISIGRGIEYEGASISMWSVERYVSQRDKAGEAPPSHLPPQIHRIFQEATTCMSVGCFNAAGTMFRLALDVATKAMLPAEDTQGLNSKIRRNLGLRLPWLFDTQRLPEGLRDLASSVKEDGNDGAHEGTLTAADAADLQDFTTSVLERVFTDSARVKLAQERRNARREAIGTSEGTV